MFEMAYLVTYLGGRLESVYTLPGAGDFYITCHCGRNYRLGRYLGEGLTYRQVLAEGMSGETVEGAELLLEIGPTVETLIAAGELDGTRLPLFRRLFRILNGEPAEDFPWDAFFSPLSS